MPSAHAQQCEAGRWRLLLPAASLAAFHGAPRIKSHRILSLTVDGRYQVILTRALLDAIPLPSERHDDMRRRHRNAAWMPLLFIYLNIRFQNVSGAAVGSHVSGIPLMISRAIRASIVILMPY